MNKPSLRSNIVANYAGQIYTTVLALMLLPAQARALGAESYGLVGFYAVLSGWLQLLDVGLSATLARETVSYRTGALPQADYRELLRTIEVLFLLLAALAGCGIVALSTPIAEHWLRAGALSTSVIAEAVALMGIAFALRWQATPSRSVLLGLERQVFLNMVNAAIATARSAGVLLALHWIAPTPRVFFTYQVVVGAVELAVLRLGTRYALTLPRTKSFQFGFTAIRRVAGFSLRVAFSGVVWVFVTQMDKLLLSKLLPLSEYAWFSLSVSAAGGIMILSAPIGQAIQPRLTFFFTRGQHEELRGTYSDATQLLSTIALTSSVCAAAMSRPFLWVWTGNAELASRMAPVFALYALGNGLLATTSMTYYLQVAHGDLRLHVRGNLIFALVLVPCIVFATARWGALGAARTWCTINCAFFLIWSALVHRRFLRGSHLRWVFRDALGPGLAGSLLCLFAWSTNWSESSRVTTGLRVAGIGVGCLIAAAITTRPVLRSLQRFYATGLRARIPRSRRTD